MRQDFAPCGHEKMGLLLSCEVAAPLCGGHEAERSEGQGARPPPRTLPGGPEGGKLGTMICPAAGA